MQLKNLILIDKIKIGDILNIYPVFFKYAN